MTHSPLFTCAYDLHSWLLDRFSDTETLPAGSAVVEQSRRLLEAVTLAVGHFDTERRLAVADEHAALLRVHLRLAADKELMDPRQLLHANRLLRDIGRQIGGWLKHLDAVE